MVFSVCHARARHKHRALQTDKHKLVTHNLGDISKVRRSVHVLLLRVMHTTSYLTYITKIKSDRFISLYHIGPVSKCRARTLNTNQLLILMVK